MGLAWRCWSSLIYTSVNSADLAAETLLTKAAYSSLMRQFTDLTAVMVEAFVFPGGELFAALPTGNCGDDFLGHGLVLAL